MSSDELLPCPFCGSDQLDEKTREDKYEDEEIHQGYVECYDCGATGPSTAWYNGGHEGAIFWLRKMHNDEGWNTRQPLPPGEPSEAVVERVAKIVKQAILVNAWSDENCRKWAIEILAALHPTGESR